MGCKGRSPAIVTALVLFGAGESLAQPIRSGVILVPVDVRVVDSRGNPVRDLTRADFQVYENDALQDIAHFETVAFDSAVDGSNLPSASTVEGISPSYRTFILLLGEGRLNHPAKGIDGLIDFVRDSLLPTDRVGVVAYLRSAEPTTDHAAVVRFLERFRERHERLDHEIQLAKGPAPTLSPATRKAIDDMFAAPGVPTFKELPGAVGRYAFRYSVGNYIRWAIADARRLPGEKHLIALSHRPLGGLHKIKEEGPNNVLVRWASGARVALSFISTGGMTEPGTSKGRLNLRGGVDAVTKDAIFRAGDHRLLTGLTGGISTLYSYAAKPLDSLERASRFQYVLGYYPRTNTAPDAQRRIKVVVRRPEVTAQYRHAYQLQPPATVEEDFRRAAADERIEAALDYLTEPTRFLGNGQPITMPRTLRISTAADDKDANRSEIVVRLAADPTRIRFAQEDGMYRATVDVAVIVDGDPQEPVGTLRREVDLVLSPSEFQRTKRQWLEFDVTVPLSGSPSRIRAAVYDYDSDRTLSAMSPIRRRQP